MSETKLDPKELLPFFDRGYSIRDIWAASHAANKIWKKNHQVSRIYIPDKDLEHGSRKYIDVPIEDLTPRAKKLYLEAIELIKIETKERLNPKISGEVYHER